MYAQPSTIVSKQFPKVVMPLILSQAMFESSSRFIYLASPYLFFLFVLFHFGHSGGCKIYIKLLVSFSDLAGSLDCASQVSRFFSGIWPIEVLAINIQMNL